MELREFQREHKQWVNHNFPDQPSWQPALGVCEEAGELAHAELKGAQNIRGQTGQNTAKAADAVGDLMIYLASYCNAKGLDLNACLVTAWKEVKLRDWIKYPKNGVNQ